MQMARRILPLLLLFVIQRTAFPQQAINWEGSIDSAKATASRSNRLVLVLFTADWCPSCHRLENDLRGQPGAAAALEAKFVPVKLNYDHFKNTAQQYGVNRLPTTVILAPNAAGDVLAVVPEAMAVDQYLAKLNGVADAQRRAAGAYAQIQASPAIGSAATANPLRTAPASPPGTIGRPVDPPTLDTPPTVPNAPAVPAAPNGPAKAAAAAPATPPASPPLPPGEGRGEGSSNRQSPDHSAPPPASQPQPMLGLDGYCPVQLIENDRWQKGNKAWGVIHRGRVYLFTGPDEQRRFQADPDRYAPLNSGHDVVLAVEVGHSVPGCREYGAKFDGHVYLFASETTLKRFESNPSYYAERALQAIRPVSQTAALR